MLRSYGRHFLGATTWTALTRIGPLSTIAPLKARNWDPIADDETKANATPLKRKPGRPRKDETSSIIKEASEEKISSAASKSTGDISEVKKTRRSRKSTPKVPHRLVQPSPNHHDLPSFLAYAERVNLNATTNVYKGTLYEYTVASVLSRLNFMIRRTGRANDLGIDLVGHFHLPLATQKKRGKKDASHELRVLVQCKALKPTPAMVRELEGAYVGAPAGWRGEGVLALLVASKEATKGVRDALQRSWWPMGLVQVTTDGEVRQFLWNAVAEDIGLAGLGVTVKYADEVKNSNGAETQSGKSVKDSIALTWMGEIWKSSDAVK